MFVRHTIELLLRDAIKKTGDHAGFDLPALHKSVKVSDATSHGDYVSTAPFLLAKLLKKAPQEIGEILKKEINKSASGKMFSAIECVGGFLNFTLDPGVFPRAIAEIIKAKKKYGTHTKRREKINLEFISANPTGLLTLGNGRGAFLGDALANVFERAGFSVVREYYINNGKASTQIQELGKTGLGTGTTYLTDDLRQMIARAMPALRKIRNKKSANLRGEVGYTLASAVHKRNKDFIEKKLKISFDTWFSEEDMYKKDGVKIFFNTLKEKNLAYEKDGAWWFKTHEYGDSEDRVLIRKTGEPTYFLVDLLYHTQKLSDRKFKTVIDIWGADHHGHIARLHAGLKALGLNPEDAHIIITQLVRLIKNGQEVKMSKRKGTFVLLEELIDEVGIDSARFFFLMHAPDTHMDFDMDLAKEKSQKNPVYYVQYSYARIASILKRVRHQKLLSSRDFLSASSLLREQEEIALIKKLVQFPEIIEDTAEDYHILRLATYAMDLSRSFHRFYETHRVISSDEKMTIARLLLVEATRIVLKNTLDCMGISAPEKM